MLEPKEFYKRVCEAFGLSPDDESSAAIIAKEIGVSKNAVYLWKGKMPGENKLRNVAEVAESTNTSLHWLLTGQGSKDLRELHEFSIDDLLSNLLAQLHELPDIQKYIKSLKIIHVISRFSESLEIPLLQPLQPIERSKSTSKGGKNERKDLEPEER
jgi:hypothetical protein